MTMMRASYLSDPTIQHLPRLLQEIREGLLAFPKFQRPLVWDQKQREELFRSVLRGLPIGTFMTWRSKTVEIPTFEHIGRIALKAPQGEGMGRQYVLDGLQRLSTFYAEFVGFDDEVSKVEAPARGSQAGRGDFDEDIVLPIAVDLRSALSDPQLISIDEGTSEEDLSFVLRLSDAMDSRRFLKRLRELEAFDDSDEFIKRAEDVATRLREYKVPVVPFVSERIEEVTEAFRLINSQGTPMSVVHMINALSWEDGFRLLDEFERCREELLSVGWNELDEKVLLRLFAIAVDLDAYAFDVTDFAKRLVEGKETTRARVVEGVKRVDGVLREGCGIYGPALVPYSAQIVVIFSVLRDEKKLPRDRQEKVAAWLWFTTYLEAFTGSINASMISRVTRELKDFLEGKAFYWGHRGKKERRSFPQNFDFRHARSRAMALLMARMQRDARDESASDDPFLLLARHGASAVQNLIPPSSGSSWRKRLGGRFLVAPEEAASVKAALESGSLAPDELRAHEVSSEALDAYVEGDYEAFVACRTGDLEAREAAHFEEVKRELGMRSVRRLPTKP